jgi:NAD(P)-dependent dehydrogenase (short-subunit alcohol dehydrogenase family)
MALDLSGKVALVTGAASGMGEASASRLAELGATVVGADVADDLGATVFGRLGPPHRYLHLDVRDENAWHDAMKCLLADLGRLDIVYLNAGVMTRPAGASALDDPLPWLTPEGYRKVMSVNADGVFYGLAAVLPSLIQNGNGSVLITSSVAGIGPLNIDPIYAMSKHALIGLATSLAPALAAKGVRLNVICPGAIDTRIVPPDMKAAIGDSVQPPSFIADVVVRVLEEGRGGEVWVASSPGEGVFVHNQE